MTLDAYAAIRKTQQEIHSRIQDLPVTDDDTVEQIIILLEKLNNSVLSVADACR